MTPTGYKPLTPARIQEQRKEATGISVERLLEFEEILEEEFRKDDIVHLTTKDKGEAAELLRHLGKVGFNVRMSLASTSVVVVRLPEDFTKEKLIVGGLALLTVACSIYSWIKYVL